MKNKRVKGSIKTTIIIKHLLNKTSNTMATTTTFDAADGWLVLNFQPNFLPTKSLSNSKLPRLLVTPPIVQRTAGVGRIPKKINKKITKAVIEDILNRSRLHRDNLHKRKKRERRLASQKRERQRRDFEFNRKLNQKKAQLYQQNEIDEKNEMKKIELENWTIEDEEEEDFNDLLIVIVMFVMFLLMLMGIFIQTM